jgi:hypothetical protein
MTPAHPDMLAVPDPASVIQLPWKPEVAWVAANCVMEGEEVAQAPRNVLRRLIAEAEGQGLYVKTGIEAEYFLLTRDGSEVSDEYDTAVKPCYDQQAVMRRYDVVREVCDYMLDLGWGPLPERPRGRQRPVRDELGIRRRAGDGRQAQLLQVHGQVGGRGTWLSRDLHAQTGRGADRERLPYTCVCLGRARRGRQTNVFAIDPTPGSATSELGLSDRGRAFLGGIMKHASGCRRSPIPRSTATSGSTRR